MAQGEASRPRTGRKVGLKVSDAPHVVRQCLHKAGEFKTQHYFYGLNRPVPSSLIRQENGAFRKRSSNRWNLRTAYRLIL